MRVRHIALIAALALAGVPAGALAAKSSHPTTPANTNANSHANGSATVTASSNSNAANAKVLFVLRGKVTSYTAGSSLGLTLKSSNLDRSTLTSGMALSLKLDSHTKVVLHNGAAVAFGDMVVVKIRAAKNASTSTLSSTAAAQVVDQGASH